MKRQTKWFHPDVELLDCEFDALPSTFQIEETFLWSRRFDCHVIDYVIQTCQYLTPGNDFNDESEF